MAVPSRDRSRRGLDPRTCDPAATGDTPATGQWAQRFCRPHFLRYRLALFGTYWGKRRRVMSDLSGIGPEGETPVNPYNLLEAVNETSDDAHMGWLIFLAIMT